MRRLCCSTALSTFAALLRLMRAPLQLPLKYIAIFVVSMMFPALDSITKEKVRSLRVLKPCPMHVAGAGWQGAAGCMRLV